MDMDMDNAQVRGRRRRGGRPHRAVRTRGARGDEGIHAGVAFCVGLGGGLGLLVVLSCVLSYIVGVACVPALCFLVVLFYVQKVVGGTPQGPKCLAYYATNDAGALSATQTDTAGRDLAYARAELKCVRDR